MDHNDDHFFQISVKGLCLNDKGKLLLALEESGNWEIPGGRIQKGENLIEALKREIKEETGLEATVLDSRPLYIYPSVDLLGRGRLMTFYAVMFDNLNFTPSDECVDLRFFTPQEAAQLHTPPQLKQLFELLM